eukprot:8143608-Lingulodinium_polyedra.AAC.1
MGRHLHALCARRGPGFSFSLQVPVDPRSPQQAYITSLPNLLSTPVGRPAMKLPVAPPSCDPGGRRGLAEDTGDAEWGDEAEAAPEGANATVHIHLKVVHAGG